MRIGHGFDVHRLVTERELILGGVKIEFARGLDGHSDADVVLHAVCDALLGALGQGDIGHHFPDNDPKFAGVDSRVLLRSVVELMEERSYKLGNLDITVVAQVPKLAPYLPQMKNNIAADLHSSNDRVNVKATTTEKLGYVGREEGIAAHAVVVLEQNHDH